MKGPLKKCVNGCGAPPHPPSWVLCKKCLEGVTKKFEALASGLKLKGEE